MKHVVNRKQPRFRDRRGHYASSAFTDLRDSYWSLIGEPRTNQTDFLGKMKMLVGSAVEAQLVKEIFGDLHWDGIHLEGTQCQVGGSSPAWDGSLDVLLKEKQEDGTYRGYVVEIKTKSGYGADELLRTLEPAKEYLAQLGLYLRDLSAKENITTGCLFYVLLSDKHFGQVLQFHCTYDSVLDEVRCVGVEGSHLAKQGLDVRLSLKEVLERFKALDVCVQEKVVPQAEYQYKFPLTTDLLASQTDNTLQKMLKGEKILGAWQPRYSGYLDKILKTDGISRQYSESEISLIRKEYLKRHPRSKM